MVRVALIGDSQLTDTSIRPVTKLGPRLRHRGHHVETRAVGGLDTQRALALQLRTEPADWTIICFGANDLAPWKRTRRNQFDTNYAELLKRANRSGILVVGPAPMMTWNNRARGPTASPATRRLPAM